MNYWVLIVFSLALIGNNLEKYSYCKFKFEINNTRIGNFGYEVYKYDENVGPAAITLYKEYAFLTDPVHGNIKRINLNDGSMIYSEKLSQTVNSRPRDIIIFNNRVYITSDLDSIYILSIDLKNVESFYINGRFRKYFTAKSNDLLEIYFDIGTKTILIDKTNKIVDIKSKIIKNPFKEIHGKSYSLEKINGNHYFECALFKIKLNEKWPNIFNNYEAVNFDFDDSRLVFFDVTAKSLILYSYRIEKGFR